MNDRFQAKLAAIQDSFDSIAKDRAKWKKRNASYHRFLTDYYRFTIPPGARVLEIGSGDGDLLAALSPSRGVGIDASYNFTMIAKARHPELDFHQGFAETFELAETFDYVILSDLVGFLEDVEMAFEKVRRVCHPGTRVVLNYYNFLWEPVLSLGSAIGLRMPQKIQNWLSPYDLCNLLDLAGFEVVKQSRKVLFPYGIPLLSAVLNRFFANLPFFRKLCLLNFVVARPKPVPEKDPSITVVVACKNEKGNIEELVRRFPEFPGVAELLFVDGRSTDGTRQEIDRVAAAYPQKKIRVFDQETPDGKGGAVRIGFEKAEGDILVILDADLSVAPEDLVKFYKLLAARSGEFMNGSRLVYQMERQAMRFLNILGNKFFSSMFSFLLEQRIKDTLCGTKALYRKDYLKIAANRSYFGDFDPFGDFDLLFGAAKLNLKIVEVPVRYYERRYGTTKIRRFYHGWLLLGMCLIAARRLKFL